jgi:hypothetical protein
LPIGKITYIDSPRCSDTVLRANLSSCDMTLNFYKLVLQFAAISSRATTLERVLDHLGEAVERCDTAVNRAKKSGSDEYIESVIDDEWVSSWAKLTKNSKRTAAVIMAAGARQGSSGNLRTALETLKIDYKNLTELVKEVVAWGKAIVKTYKQELAALKLL